MCGFTRVSLNPLGGRKILDSHASDTQTVEFRVHRVTYFLQALALGVLAALSWYFLDRWLHIRLLSLSLTVLLAFEAARSVAAAIVQPPFKVVRIAADSILGPGRAAGVQLRVPKDEVIGLKRARGKLLIYTKNKDAIRIVLRHYGSEAEELVRRVELWFGRAAA